MPQLAQSPLDAFKAAVAADESTQRQTLAAMSIEAKLALLAQLKTPTSHGASGSWNPPGMMDKISPYLPTWHDVPPAAGAAIGAYGGPPGMLLGAMTGEAISQLAEHATGSPRAPKTSGQAAGQEAFVAGASILPEVASAAKQGGSALARALWRRGAQLTRSLPGIFHTSETLATQALDPADIHFQNKLPLALNEIKRTENVIGPTTNYTKLLQNTEVATRQLNEEFNQIIQPQRAVISPGSGVAMKQAQVEAIPDTIRLTRPSEYSRILDKIDEQPSKDFNFGELNRIRISGNKLLDPKYGKPLSRQLTIDETLATAIEKAKTDKARELLYTGLDRYGLGGSEAAREIGQRMGAVIEFQSGVESKANKIIAQRLPTVERSIEMLRRGARALNPWRSMPIEPPIENNLILALRRWPYRAQAAEANLRNIAGPERLLTEGVRRMPAPETSFVEAMRAEAAPETRETRLGRLLMEGTPENIANQPAYRSGAVYPNPVEYLPRPMPGPLQPQRLPPGIDWRKAVRQALAKGNQ